MRLRGYRSSDADLLAGPWLPGELLGLPIDDWPPLAAWTSVPPPANPSQELCIAPGLGFVRYAELDWVHRRARVEIGLRATDGLDVLLKTVVAHGFLTLNLSRVYGWVTPVLDPPTGLLADVGFRREAVLPESTWLDGRPVDREIWGVVRND
jgi:hypothetical protein